MVHEPCHCRPRLKYKRPEYQDRRNIARRIMLAAASEGLDNFSQRQIAQTYRRVYPRLAPNTYWGFGPDEWSTFTWLRQHGFIEPTPDAPRTGSHRRYQLSEQAIRWLDWTDYDWEAVA